MKKDVKLNLDLKQLPKQFTKYGHKFRKYAVVIGSVTILAIYGFLILQISNASSMEPNEDDITLQLSTVKRLKIDQQAIDKILQLEDQNVVVQALFEDARNDPFSE